MAKIYLEGMTTEELLQMFREQMERMIIEFSRHLNQDADIILTRNEVCEYLKIDLSTLHLWTKQGRLPVYSIGNRRYFKKSEVLQCLVPYVVNEKHLKYKK